MSNELLRRDPDVVAAELDGKPMLLQLRSWTYMAFDEVGARIWSHLAEPLDSRSLVAALLAEYEGDEAAIRGDVDRFIEKLHGDGFLVRG
jgi:hypothetical protein